MLRISDIVGVVIKYRLDEYLFRGANTQLLLLAGKSIRSVFAHKYIDGTIGYRIRKALEELGPVYVKFGQMLSARPDIIPPSIVKELELLRESVQPFDSHTAVKILEDDLGLSLDEIFSSFDLTPIAAGSVAQVHHAVLITGETVAVKILRPNIEIQIKKDIALFRQVVSLVEIYKPDIKKIKISKIIDELSYSILAELDLRKEASNIARFAENMKELPYVHVPRVYSQWSGKNTLTMERMQGTPINHVDELREQGVDIDKLISQGLESLVVQIFRDGFFHADQHPGNLWIKPDGTRIYLDFGFMGELSKQDRTALLRIIFALYTNNTKKIILLITEAGWLPLAANSAEIENVLNTASQSIVNRRQQDFSLGKVVTDLFRSLEKFDVSVPYQFTLLAKTILVVEGITKQLTPYLDMSTLIGPILLKYFASEKKTSY
jgi:ubiquinone biosynthesis protein